MRDGSIGHRIEDRQPESSQQCPSRRSSADMFCRSLGLSQSIEDCAVESVTALGCSADEVDFSALPLNDLSGEVSNEVAGPAGFAALYSGVDDPAAFDSHESLNIAVSRIAPGQ